MEYSLIRSSRKTLSIEIDGEGRILVRAPKQYSQTRVEQFLKEKSSWIEAKVALQEEKRRKKAHAPVLSEREKTLYREKAREVLNERASYYAAIMNVDYGRVAIREQKTRWGSCSAIGNLNFNWKLIMMPPGVLDYVVVHELAHRKEMNHSKRFWDVVEEVIPDYRIYRKWLKENGQTV